MHDSKPSNNLTYSVVQNPDATMSVNSENFEEKNLSATQLGSPLEEEVEKTSTGETNLSAETGINQSFPDSTSKRLRGRPSRRSKQSTEGKHVSRSMGSARVLRSRSQETRKLPKPNNNLQDISAGTSGENIKKKTMKKMKMKKKQTKDVAVDEFSRTRKHLKYLLHRMAYEQNLIDAYSGEGWKGQSAEKLRPEKELQRAKSEIFRCKLKVRDLFQRIDVSITEGRLPQSLFDSEGEIDSEDIFCAKCGLKDVTLENDIILCDGACERAFHQFCVQPPLLSEDIPPDEDGWLCPECDCKDDCIDLINESQGTTLSILDSWEKVYPDVAAADGKSLDNLELPSDDSEDDDFKPDEPEVEEKDENEESCSDESDTYSASEDSEVALLNGPKLQLSSEDSEDDDFDPDAADVNEEVKPASSSSDFTSDSEDLNAVINANEGSPHEKSTMLSEIMHEPSKIGRGKRPSLLETSSSQRETALISARREVERLDYKKLYDEQYGDVPTDSSDEEFFDAVDAPKRRRKNNSNSEKPPKRRARKKLETGGTTESPVNLKKISSPPGSSAKTSASRRLEATNQEQYGNVSTESSNEEYFDAADAPKRPRKVNTASVKTPKRKAHKKLDTGGANDSPLKSNKVPSEPASSSAKVKLSASKRLGEAATQGLLISFKENQYPKRATKEKLAEELGITTHQVSKWFGNARWSFRHSPHLGSKLADIPNKGTSTQINQSNVTLNMSVGDVKSGDQNEEPTNGKNHVPMDDSKDTSNSFGTQQKVEKKGRLNGRKSARSTPNKSSTKILPEKNPSNEDTQKSCGPSEVSKAPEKRTRGRPKKLEI